MDHFVKIITLIVPVFTIVTDLFGIWKFFAETLVENKIDKKALKLGFKQRVKNIFTQKWKVS